MKDRQANTNIRFSPKEFTQKHNSKNTVQKIKCPKHQGLKTLRPKILRPKNTKDRPPYGRQAVVSQ
jgi:hypothetical protein